ncbi:hypothetical protein PFAG_03459 [Plasmodium falciparum Santa Lucia]|uniref:Uncharacterized protein n=2 Tax=Plasmodium falciparum TaxID=5833 RepID=W7EZI2_PLAF8|nr:hypothetical protein PFBG_03529 [Plasmodium falciparum 7G8]EUT83584.1 hypothetical protein PFAG_03459 [Plasmodium falciparum Santa Lucia]
MEVLIIKRITYIYIYIYNQNIYSATFKYKNINLIIILTKELRKQKKIHIVYNHILNKVLNELNYLNEEKKYFKNKISVTIIDTKNTILPLNKKDNIINSINADMVPNNLLLFDYLQMDNIYNKNEEDHQVKHIPIFFF